MIQKLQNAGKFITTSGSGYIPPSRGIIPNKKLPTAATINQWLKGTFSYITGIKDSDLIESKYRPSKETNTTTKYYTRKGLDYDVMRNLLGGKESSAKTFEGEPLYYKNFNDLYNRLSNKTYRKGRQLRTTDNSHLGEYTIGIGEDNNGRYVSYYDKFDWAPNEKLEIFSPYEIYNRIYEKDFNRMQKELNNETYSGSNPSGNWFFKSGMNNKGYFKFGGKTANARKWKHQNGGIIKADDGTKLTFGQKLNNFFNSDSGQTITNGVSQLFNGIQQANNQSKLNDRLQKWKQAYINSIQPEDYTQEIEQEEQQLKQANPDYNSSPITMAHQNWLRQQKTLNSAKQKAAQEADMIIQQQLTNNNQQQSGSFNIGNMIQMGQGIFSMFKKNDNIQQTNTV